MQNTLDATHIVEEGLISHKKGDLESALACYQKALDIDPNCADAHNLLANIYCGSGQNLKALYHANLALSLKENAQFFNTRGMLLIGMSKFQEALSDLKLAIKHEPNFLEAHNNLSIAYHAIGDFKRAKQHAEIATKERPSFVEAWISLAAVEQDLGFLQDASNSLTKALALDEDNILALVNMAKVSYLMLDSERAIEYAQQALAQGYIGIDLYFPLAHSLINLKRLPEAANVLIEGFNQTKLEAFKELPKILAQDIFFKILYDCVQYLATAVGNPNAGLRIYEKCVLHAPDVAHAIWINMGTIYFQLHLIDDAIRCNEESLKCNPNQIWAMNNLGVFNISKEDSKKAIAYFEQALSLDPNFAPSLGWLLKEKAYICDWTHYDELRSKVGDLRFSGNTTAIAPFVSLAVYDDPAQLLYWAQLSAQDLFNPILLTTSIDRPPSTSDKKRKKRIGYYSFDFRNHPVAHLTARLFEVHDHEKYDIYAYSYGPDDGSAVRDRIKAGVKEFIDVKDLSVIDTARRIAEDEIDLLIDLTGNTLHNRSQVFALRPAKVQAHWLGFVGTMGSHYYDYIIADDIMIPVEDEQYFSEKVMRLPSGMHITDDTRVISSGQTSRAANGLPEEGVIFGCFCQTFKIQPEIFSSWMEILKQVPHSVLWLANGPQGAIENLKASAADLGVDPDRIVVATRCAMDEYLNRLGLIDLYLDTFPYTSGTVASDALFVGCPLLTLSGKTMVSRMAGSILSSLGLTELITFTLDDYVKKAVDLGFNLAERERIRQFLIDQKSKKVLFNCQKSAVELETRIEKITL